MINFKEQTRIEMRTMKNNCTAFLYEQLYLHIVAEPFQ